MKICKVFQFLRNGSKDAPMESESPVQESNIASLDSSKGSSASKSKSEKNNSKKRKSSGCFSQKGRFKLLLAKFYHSERYFKIWTNIQEDWNICDQFSVLDKKL